MSISTSCADNVYDGERQLGDMDGGIAHCLCYCVYCVWIYFQL
jgi:hypothetical protein